MRLVESSPRAEVSTTRRPEARLRRHPKVLVRETPEIAVELLYDISREIAPLFVRFWKESGKDGIPLDPDWDALLRMTATGTLKIVTVRFEGRLVGFLLNVV